MDDRLRAVIDDTTNGYAHRDTCVLHVKMSICLDALSDLMNHIKLMIPDDTKRQDFIEVFADKICPLLDDIENTSVLDNTPPTVTIYDAEKLSSCGDPSRPPSRPPS